MVFSKSWGQEKRQGPDYSDKMDTSVFDFSEEEEEVVPLHSSNSRSIFRPYFRRSKEELSSALACSSRKRERPFLRKPQKEDRLNMRQRQPPNLQKSYMVNSIGKHTPIVITASRAKLGDQYVQSPCLTFSAKCIEVKTGKGSANGLLIQWPLEEVSSFKSFYEKYGHDNENGLIMLEISRETAIPLGQCSGIAGSSEHDSYILEVDNREWTEQQPKVFALSENYKRIWKRLTREEAMKCKEWLSRPPSPEVADCGRTTEALEIFEALVFPQEDPDAVTITKKDLQMLRPMEFLNDTIIDFYIKYLQSKLAAKNQEDFYFFNSFFFRKLADSDRSLGHGKTTFECVKKWTRKVNLFNKNYIFIPINQSFHWSLIIICHPGNMRSSAVNDMFTEMGSPCLGTPCILHLDSLEGSHSDIERHIRNYLLEEWIERTESHQASADSARELFPQLQFVHAKVPQQDNHCDCGLFLLHYVELFLKAAPKEFSLARSEGFPYFLTRNWFKPSDASRKRLFIRSLILKLHCEFSSIGTADELRSPLSTGRPNICISPDSHSIASDFLRSPLSTGRPNICISADSHSIASDFLLPSRNEGLVLDQATSPTKLGGCLLPSFALSSAEDCHMGPADKSQSSPSTGGAVEKLDLFRSSLSTQDVQELSSDNELEHSSQHRLRNSCPNILLKHFSRRTTRSETHRYRGKDLSPQEQARQLAVSTLCRKKANRGLKVMEILL